MNKTTLKVLRPHMRSHGTKTIQLAQQTSSTVHTVQWHRWWVYTPGQPTHFQFALGLRWSAWWHPIQPSSKFTFTIVFPPSNTFPESHFGPSAKFWPLTRSSGLNCHVCAFVSLYFCCIWCSLTFVGCCQMFDAISSHELLKFSWYERRTIIIY